MIISKVCNLGHSSVLSLLNNSSANFGSEYFQIGLPTSIFPKIRGSFLFTADIEFLRINISSISKIEVIDVLGCKLRLEEKSQDLSEFDSDKFVVPKKLYMQLFKEIEEFVSPETNFTLDRYDAKIKEALQKYLPSQQRIEKEIWLKIPTFIQVAFNGFIEVGGASHKFVIPNWLQKRSDDYVSVPLYYNPRGGIEAAINAFILDRNI